jgi:protein O-GlcNAc transferase
MNFNPTNPSQETKPDHPTALTQTAEMYYAQGKLAEAIAFCRRALEVKPDWAPAYVTMGNVQQAQGQIEEAIRFYSEALAFNPEYAEAYANLGSMLYKQGRFVEAVVNYEKAIALKPTLAAAYWNISTALNQLGKTEDAKSYQEKALAINPQIGGAESYLNQGDQLANAGKLDEAIDAWKQAIELKPDLVDAHCQIGIILRYQGKPKAAINYLEKALAIKPDFVIAHQHLCGILRDAIDLTPARQAVQKYSQMCGEIDPIMTAIYFISTYQVSGLNQIAKERFLELESYLYHAQKLSNVEIKSLYGNLLFSTPYLRDDLAANSQLYHLISEKYIEQIIQPNHSKVSLIKVQPIPQKTQLKIGFLSNHFNRHSVGWCSADIIGELCKITPNVYLYATEKLDADDQTQIFTDNVAKLTYPKTFPNGLANANEIIKEIQQDEVDILVDLDSLSVPIHCEILYQQPAAVCVSWLGFDAPYISQENYFLSDRHAHPEQREKYYKEQLIRMPDSFVAVRGFKRLVAEKIDLRKSYRIDLEQIVYLCVSPGRKFNHELVKAQIAILKQVPNSILIHKAIGDHNVFQSAYHQACEAEGIGKHRVKFLPRVPTEEEHRLIYLLADVLLDSYPYNGGTHTLEALWFNLPVVTRVGEQFLSRMGYSFLQTLGIKTGVSSSWEEYIEWGIKLGNNLELRNGVREQLIKSKRGESLSPLWNPQKFAQDMYKMLVELLAK